MQTRAKLHTSEKACAPALVNILHHLYKVFLEFIITSLQKNEVGFLLQLLSCIKLNCTSSNDAVSNLYWTVAQRSKMVSNHVKHWMANLRPVKNVRKKHQRGALIIFLVKPKKKITPAMHTSFFIGWPIASSMMHGVYVSGQ